MIFGALTVPDDALGRPSLALGPSSPYGARTPMHTHPAHCAAVPTFKEARWTYRDRLHIASDPAYVRARATPQRGLRWGDYVTLVDGAERLTPAMLAFFADCFVSYPAVLPTLADRNMCVPPPSACVRD